jgi:hypothetical protein
MTSVAGVADEFLIIANIHVFLHSDLSLCDRLGDNPRFLWGASSISAPRLNGGILPRALLFVSRVYYVPRELRIAVITEVAHRVPKIYCPLMFVFHEGRESRGALGEELPAYFRHQPPRNPLSPEFGRHSEPINVTAPTVPSTDHRANDLVVDCCDQEQGRRLTDQVSQPFD